MARYFTRAQKLAIFVTCGGCCRNCGEELPSEWDAHHVRPFASGGRTDTENGEALCLKCHIRKHQTMIAEQAKYGNFRKDYSWQERAIEKFMNERSRFYSLEAGQFECAYVVEVSPSGGKSTFSMKLARSLIVAGLIDKVIWVVPRDSIKLGFKDDVSNVDEMPKEHRLLADRYFRIDTSLDTTYKGMFANYHGAVITYQALPRMLEYFELLGRKYRILFVLDEAHHGKINDADEAASVWGEAMEQCRSRACAVVCMTGTPVRADNKRIPFLAYEAVSDLQGQPLGWKVKPDFAFSYQDAVIAGIARKVVCRSQDPTITYEITDNETGVVTEHTKPVSAVTSLHLARIKNTALCFERGVIDELLKIAHQECDQLRQTGDSDAAVLVIARRDSDANEAKNLLELKRRITKLFGEQAVTVESTDREARQTIAAFKRGTDKWIVAKEMISEGTNLPRVRVILILRDIGNRTFYEQLVHRATRNDADDRPQDAFIIQLKFPNLHEWCSDLEKQALLAIEIREKKQPSGRPGDPSAPLLIEGICAEADGEVVVIEGEDFTEVDPIGRKLHAVIGEATKTSRWQLDKILKAMPGIGIGLPNTEIEQNAFSVDEQIERYVKMGEKDCRRAAQNLGGDSDAFAKITAEAKRTAGIKCKLKDLARSHPQALDAAKKFAEAARRAYQRSRAPQESDPGPAQGTLI
jgi:superfamily II DNA or RNA helicase